VEFLLLPFQNREEGRGNGEGGGGEKERVAHLLMVHGRGAAHGGGC
jgi:hypothetical protein